MRDYLLFIDTETSGLPKRWDVPYHSKNVWPYAIQVSWIIYNKDGIKIKEENKYINDADFEIAASALEIHKIEPSFLRVLGVSRKEVLAALSIDLKQYQPLIVGHFIELDYHVLSADYYRAGIENLMAKLPAFCTMLATTHLVDKPVIKYLKLGDLYELLFNTPLLNQHNALYDAEGTAACFFELIKRDEIKTFEQPPIIIHKKSSIINSIGWAIVILIALILTIIIMYNK